MAFKDQWIKIQDNWLIIVLVFVALVLLSGIGGNFGGMSLRSVSNMAQMEDMSYGGYAESKMYAPTAYHDNGDFAPDVEERKITKTASMTTETKRGEFRSAEQRLKDIVKGSESFLLSENVNKYGTERKQYYQGSYTIKVDNNKYDAVVSQLKEIGEVHSFNENTQDITGRYTNVQLNLEVEKARLERYQALYEEAKEVSDKLEINDRIFDQERTIKYLEDSINNMDKKVEYSTIYLNMNEKRSDYANIALTKLSTLLRNMVESFNGLLNFLFVVLPWADFAGIVYWIYRLVKKRNPAQQLKK